MVFTDPLLLCRLVPLPVVHVGDVCNEDRFGRGSLSRHQSGEIPSSGGSSVTTDSCPCDGLSRIPERHRPSDDTPTTTCTRHRKTSSLPLGTDGSPVAGGTSTDHPFSFLLGCPSTLSRVSPLPPPFTQPHIIIIIVVVVVSTYDRPRGVPVRTTIVLTKV